MLLVTSTIKLVAIVTYCTMVEYIKFMEKY